MNRKKLDGLICILAIVALVLAVGAGGMYWKYASMRDAEQIQASDLPPTSAPSEPQQTLGAEAISDRSMLFEFCDAELAYTQGETVKLSDFRGEVVVLFFWSSWCGDCKEYFVGDVREAVQAAEQSNAVFLMVCREGVRGETLQTASECLEKYNIDRDTLMDEDAAFYWQMGLSGVPSMAFISPEGRLMLTTNELLDAPGMRERVLYAAGDAAEQTEAFVCQNLMSASGSVAASYSVNSRKELKAKDIQLAETQGLMMKYALEKGNKTLFEEAFAFVQNELSSGGICAWKKEAGETHMVNAALDDLRIISSLIRAQAQWGGYEREISLRERALWHAVVKDDMLIDFIEIEKNARSQQTTLCYLDIGALDDLAAYRDRWQSVRDVACALLESGLISEAFPLYYSSYDNSRGIYSAENLQMNEAMLTVLHAVRADIVEKRTLDYLQSVLKEGPVYASYLITGEPSPGYEYESTATYALLVQIGVDSGRDEITRLALMRMEKNRNFDGLMAGGYGTEAGTVHHTFDDLQALLAWACM